MEHKIDEKHFRIEFKGTPKEVKDLARCIVEVNNKNFLVEFDSFIFGEDYQDFNVDSDHRLYLCNSSLIYLPNVNGAGKKFHFKLIKEKYNLARKLFENRYSNL